MDTLAPQSVLDSRHREGTPVSWRVNPDRLTRATSPGRLTKRPSNENIEEVLLSRIDQPYRTSFSAVTTPIKTKRHRSRSTSPGASSMKSEKSSKSNRGSKHVTYNTNVTVRHSDSFENQDLLQSRVDFDMSDKDTSVKKLVYLDSMTDSSPTQKEEAVMPRKDEKKEDYSSQIQEVTQMIVNEYSKDTPKHEDEVNKTSTPAPKVYRTKPPLPGKGRGRGTPNGRPPLHPSDVGPRNVVAWEYEHDRTINYRKAMSNHYTDDKHSKDPHRTPRGDRSDHPTRAKLEYPADPEQRVNQPADLQPRMERSSSMPLQPEEETNRLAPPKRTVSSSIGNFFRRLSPRLGRKSKKDRSNESMSTLSDSGHGGCASDENLSRSKFRQSFKKFLGRGSPKPRGKKYSKDGSTSSLAKSDVELLDHEPRSRPIPTSSNRMMESIKQNSDRDRDVYQKFKEKQSPNHPFDARLQQKQQPVRVSGEDTPPANTSQQSDSRDYNQSPSSPDYQLTDIPDIVMDVTYAAPRTPNNMATSELSPHSDSKPMAYHKGSDIDFSQDIDLTVSEPSLSTTDAVDGHIGHHGDNILTLTSERPLSPLAASTPAIPAVKSGRRTQSEPTNDNGLNISSMPKLADSGDLPLQECTKSPSYLKLSCAVSGYGKYSQYSSYRDIEKRSPYSSVSSSRSDLLSPDTMPVTKVTSPDVRRTSSECGYEFGLISPQPLSVTSSLGSHGDLLNGEELCNGVSNGDCNGMENGHILSDERYPTGDPKLDGAYFLRLTELEMNSLSSHCAHVEVDLQCGELPEEASGKIRAAIGKANLLVNQKCKQFQDLCMQHIEPSEDKKLLKVEDLQGFWDMIKLQIDSVYRMFAEIELSRQNGWKEPTAHSQNSSVNSSPKSGSLSLSNASTPSGTPGSRRRAMKVKETPESSPERTEKMRAAARAREEARKRMLAEKRAAMRQKQQQKEVEIYVATDSAN
ncbi:uncharacterized protein LOC110453514 [Mizuhopecten yessoensis]|uniref:Disks large-associated protein 3 n=1 Tax=Mizuhopecten yessoensis TaxID=6573 RepID=A0A210QH57_MIZYE|nr:uncharacterized protein LOC110453514 [Mizuhopecten yessoensis]XP_021358147.1 uncharacterized protein LOC110453514 [Mizuhopecten yessoensis]XP_021358148.1 uncharacterized protein LOC110453514 [Mizuhopecten yessoensis]XP_021358149.1 uncharacterized protein LOC110453514 [Mizuhopecten yessoensis]OWF48105.1 Disks large-associated protein 3 [Mizuhopecten yessoensis]